MSPHGYNEQHLQTSEFQPSYFPKRSWRQRPAPASFPQGSGEAACPVAIAELGVGLESHEQPGCGIRQ